MFLPGVQGGYLPESTSNQLTCLEPPTLKRAVTSHPNQVEAGSGCELTWDASWIFPHSELRLEPAEFPGPLVQ